MAKYSNPAQALGPPVIIIAAIFQNIAVTVPNSDLTEFFTYPFPKHSCHFTDRETEVRNYRMAAWRMEPGFLGFKSLLLALCHEASVLVIQ